MPLYTADALRDNPPVPVPSYIGDGLLPKTGRMLITGRTESGKSVLAFDIAFSLVLKEPLFGAWRQGGKPYFPVKKPCKVLYLDSELGPSGCHLRLRQFYQQRCPAIDLSEYFKIVTGEFDPLLLHATPALQGPLANLTRLIEQHRPDVLIVDPLSDFHIVDENSNEIRLVFRELRALQNTYKFATILLHHESDKDAYTNEGRVIQKTGTGRSRGHSAITQDVDTHIAVRRERKNPYALVELRWEKVRHQSHPPNGYVLVDFTRMYVKWVGTKRFMEIPANRKHVLDDHSARFPLSPEDAESTES